jgi:ketosteroid isomerase-like protein
MFTSKRAGVALSVLLAATLAACAKPEAVKPAVDTAAFAEDVKEDLHQLIADFNAHDAAKAVGHDAPDYVGMFHGLPNVKGPAEDLALTKQQVADPLAKVSVSDETVDVAASGDMAVYRATYAYDFTDPKTKGPTTEHGNWVLGYKREADGSLKIAWGVIADTPAPTAAPAAPPK